MLLVAIKSRVALTSSLGYVSVTVSALSSLKSEVIRRVPSFFFTKTLQAAQGDEAGSTTLLLSSFCISARSTSSSRGERLLMGLQPGRAPCTSLILCCTPLIRTSPLNTARCFHSTSRSLYRTAFSWWNWNNSMSKIVVSTSASDMAAISSGLALFVRVFVTFPRMHLPSTHISARRDDRFKTKP